VSEGSGCPLPRKFLHFHVEMALWGGILAVNFKFYSMHKTVKVHQNATNTSAYDAIKRGKQQDRLSSLVIQCISFSGISTVIVC